MIINVPGDILEFGVFKGISLIRFLTYRTILENNLVEKFMVLILNDFPWEKRC